MAKERRLISPSHSSLDNVNDRVNLSLYYETSLCPYAFFISNNLVKVIHTDLHTIINLRLVPWGNAKIHCQNGEEECHLNIIHSCVIHFWPDVHLEFIYCIEQQSLKRGLTAYLKSPQEYVPWVVVNNQPLRQDFENFMKYVCQAYKKDHKPTTLPSKPNMNSKINSGLI
ncbi:hypothetical protein V6Z11_A13G146500 [Gossypium hirsutum]